MDREVMLNAREMQAYESSSSSLMMRFQGLGGKVLAQVCWSTLTFGTSRDQYAVL